ncbi:hypothetical protein BDV98DRAFT_509360 [Pterulicium gracile]|uniref:Uncharacterized protein n=1 Tax=Pterulicium gracile TaxID=1884261 RepID=A0A5C3QIJ9_9AGAR|nr:hypothetical protein BDV98DRAFT_509360 [Pterula gracilis]
MKQQMIRQWHMYALNNSGNITDSTFSPSSTPANASHPANYNQWAQLHVNRTMNDLNIPDGADDLRSMQSSPSHEPLNARAPNDVGVRSVNKRFQPSRRRVPARVASTQPRETSPEPDSSSGEETAGEEAGKFYLGPNGVPVVDDEDEEEGDWVDEDEDDEDDEDLLDLEFHPSYVRSSEKRRRRWEVKWANLVEAFHALDRQTASTLVMLAAPSHSKKLHSVVSRSIKRDPSLSSSTQFRGIRTSFSRLSNHQRAIKHSQKPQSLSALILSHAQTGVGSSTGGTSEREEELRRALQLTLGTLSVVGGIFEQREARFKEEIKRVGMDKATVAELVGRVLGVDPANLNLNHPNGNQSPPPHFAMNPAAYWQPDLPFPPGYAVPNGGECFGQSEGEYVRRVPIRAVSSSELSEAGEENANGLASEVGDVGQAM